MMLTIKKNGSTVVSTDIEGRTIGAPLFLCTKSKETKKRKSTILTITEDGDRFSVFTLDNDVELLMTGSHEYYMCEDVDSESRPVGRILKTGILKVEI